MSKQCVQTLLDWAPCVNKLILDVTRPDEPHIVQSSCVKEALESRIKQVSK